jgi:nucleotide-binding universal stress UspA family protein
MFERIVVAVDGSEPAQRAVPVAADIASRYRSEVIVLHVFDEDVARGGPVSPEAPRGSLDVADRTARLFKDVGVSARAEVRGARVGGAAHEIVRLAVDEDAGLIVIGSLGTSDWQGLSVGSIAHHVAHLSSVPVLTVR